LSICGLGVNLDYYLNYTVSGTISGVFDVAEQQDWPIMFSSINIIITKCYYNLKNLSKKKIQHLFLKYEHN
jgi:hypothetical protein